MHFLIILINCTIISFCKISSIFSFLHTFLSLHVSAFLYSTNFPIFLYVSLENLTKQKMRNCSFLVPLYFFLRWKLKVTTTAISHRLVTPRFVAAVIFCNLTTVINQFHVNIRSSYFYQPVTNFLCCNYSCLSSAVILDVFLNSSWRRDMTRIDQFRNSSVDLQASAKTRVTLGNQTFQIEEKFTIMCIVYRILGQRWNWTDAKLISFTF